MALIQRLPVVFTGPDAENLPQLLPGVGVGGYFARYLAQLLPGTEGDTVTSVPNVLGAGLRLASTGTPKLRLPAGTDGDRYVELNSATDDKMSVASPPAVRTMAIVVRVDVAPGVNSLIFAGGGINIARNPSNNTDAYGGAGFQGPGLPSGQWAVLVVTFGGPGATTMNVDGVEVTGNSGSGVPAIIQMGTGDDDFSWADLIFWDRVLDADERASVVAALSTGHAGLLAS